MAETTHDCFICHASEDKEAIARPLAGALRERGYDVWYDEFELGLGDSLSQAIERGLAGSRFGVVVLSERFFEKEWPQHELNGLTAREIIGSERVLLPVWHGIDEKFLVDVAPTLADRVAVRADGGLDAVIDAIAEAIERRRAVPDAEATVESPPPPAEPSMLVEGGERIRLGYSDAELRKFAEEGGDRRGLGWLSVIVGPVALKQDLFDPTAITVDELGPLAVQGLWEAQNPPLLGAGLVPGLDGFTVRHPPGRERPPLEEIRLHEDGLMEHGKTLARSGFFSRGDPVQDRMIATHSVAVYIHDWTLTFLRVLEHVGYRGEAVAHAVFAQIEGFELGVTQNRFYPNKHVIEVSEVESRPLRGLAPELPGEVNRWVKKTMDRLFLAGGISTGAYFLDADGEPTE